MDLLELRAVAADAAQVGARVAMSWQQRPEDRVVREKDGPRDLVSQADTETEHAIREVIARRRPDDQVLGEEHGLTAGTGPVSWLVDPIDGTTSYLYGRADWSVSVAAVGDDGQCLAAAVCEPVYQRTTTAALGLGTSVDGRRVRVSRRTDLAEALVEINLGRPDQHALAGSMLDVLFPAVRDLRRGGSAASALAHAAAGRADAVWSPGLQPWDGAAGALLVHEAGGRVGDLDGPSGARWPATGDVLAAPGALWDPLRELLAAVYPVSAVVGG
jgi:myo-inositol-1(or 4)-monophosphatase